LLLRSPPRSATVEVNASHVAYMKETAKLIEEAAADAKE
jgi:hypothetical protein